MISFRVDGMPATKGSWRVFTNGKRPRFVADDESEKAWAELVGWSARAVLRGHRADDRRYQVRLAFTLLPPPSKRRTNRRDIDKLARSVLDSLTGILWRDDEQVDVLLLSKTTGAQPGVVVTVEPTIAVL